mgnify:CR=1 FL=1
MKNKKPMTTLKKVRQEKGLTQKDLAEKVGIDWHVLSTYERGVRQPDIVIIYNLAVALDCSIDSLIVDLL